MSKSVGLICFLFLMPIALAIALLWAGSGSDLAMTSKMRSGMEAPTTEVAGDSPSERFSKDKSATDAAGLDRGGGATW